MLAVIVVQIQNAQLAINASRTSKVTDLRTYGVSESALNSEVSLLLARAGKPHKNCVFLHGVLIPGPSCSKPDINPGLT